MWTNPLEGKLIDALQPVRFHTLATCIYHLFDTGLFDALAEANESLSTDSLAKEYHLDPYRLEAFLKYLRAEGILEENEGRFKLSETGKRFGEFRVWYTLLIGGYSSTFLQMGEALRLGAEPATRNLTQVGVGSCGISHYDAIPLTRKLMEGLPQECHQLLDLGCGNGLYLVEFCKALPHIKAWGVEPDEGSYRKAIELAQQNGLEDRVRFSCNSALGFLQEKLDYEPDFAVLGFVLHEILGQEGEVGVRNFLCELTDRFPRLHLIVIEVDLQIDNPQVMRHGLALAYYNPYYLLHPFTKQRLESLSFWEHLFECSQLEILRKESADAHIDSTGLEVGYLLRKRS